MDCLIVGGGPAGLTAAIYFARYRRSACVIDDGASRALLIPESHNYPGFKGIAGPALIARLRDQAASSGATLEHGRVTSLVCNTEGGFIAKSGTKEIETRSVLLATGLVDETPRIEGLRAAIDKGVIRYCPICDGFEGMDRRIGVLGSVDSAGKKALFLRTYTREVTLFETTDTASREMRQALKEAGVRLAGRPTKIHCSDRNVALTLNDGVADVEVDVDVVYPALGCTVRSELATRLGAKCSDTGNLRVNDCQQTTIDMLYAAGDVVSDLHQLSVGAGHAAIAATDIHNRLPRNLR